MTPDALKSKLTKHCNALNALLAEVRKEHPKACMYLDATDNLNLMSGPPHDDCSNSDIRGTMVHARQDRIICSAKLHADGGDW